MTTFPDFSPPQQRHPLRIATDLPLHSWYSYDSPPGSSSPTDRSLTPSGTSTDILDHALHVLCMYDFVSPDPDHLCFSRGEVLSIVKKEESGWWAAMRPQGDRIGWIPSSFVQSLTSDELDSPQTPRGHSRAVEYSNQISWTRDGRPEFDDSPRTAIHESWVHVSEDPKAQSLVTPTALVPHTDFLDADGEHTPASFVGLSDTERLSSVTGEFRFPPPTPQGARGLHCPPSTHSPIPLERPESLMLLAPQPEGAPLRRHFRPRAVVVDDQASLLRLTKLLDADSGAPQPAPLPQGCNHGDKIGVQVAKRQGLPASPRPTHIDFSNTNFKAPSHKIYSNLTIWSPDNVAQYLCVMMHTLYASICQHECLAWIRISRSSEHSGLRHFFDAHERLTWWVQKSILVHGDLSKRTDALGFWIQVAEKCLDLRNHDSLGAITLALTAVPIASLRATWSQCTQEQAFMKLSDTVDISNEFNGLVEIMDEADGPSVPFIHACLGHIKSHDVTHQLDYDAKVAPIARRRKRFGVIANILRHQSVRYDLEVARSTRRFVDDQLQEVGWATSSWLLTRSQEIQQAELGGSQN